MCYLYWVVLLVWVVRMSEKVMKQYRFILEPYKGISSRYTCPQCKRNKVFVRYIDTEHKYRFPDYVGKCNRENNCNYHLTPKEYFKDENIVVEHDIYASESSQVFIPEVTHISISVLEKSKRAYTTNHLFSFCSSLFGIAKTTELFDKYHVGTASFWQGATTFWQMDIEGKVRTGKVMLYNSITGRRVKNPYNHINWVHSILKIENFHLEQCFFGEHLLNGNNQTVAIVESEKTALIASQYLPQFLWLACGGKTGCLKSRLHILENRKVILFPDINACDDWEKIAEEHSNISIFNYLEKDATSDQKSAGLDISDFLILMNTPENILSKMAESNPVLYEFIEIFGLEITI